ncbi:MAG: PqqD family peptide modification chaperone [Desulfobulbaceae bacterium]|nr:MAG: PqqD family peptide modification chaperone [Desulfobulbaceae bacterium]
MTTLLDSHIPVLNSDFKTEQFDNEILLYSVTSTLAVYLNQTAMMVYGLCDGNNSVGDIITTLETAYPEQISSIRADVTDSLQQLVDLGAIRLSA